MRLLVGALVLSLVVATTAAVFAIWPVITDAPWEDTESTEVTRTFPTLTPADVITLVLSEICPNKGEVAIREAVESRLYLQFDHQTGTWLVSYTRPLTPETADFAGATFAVHDGTGEVTFENEQAKDFRLASKGVCD